MSDKNSILKTFMRDVPRAMRHCSICKP